MKIKSIGLPTMHKEEGEKRAFLPSFVKMLKKYDVDVYIEEDYGRKMGYKPEDYITQNDRVKIASHDEVYKQDLVIVLKAPNFDELDQMREYSGLISMLHYDSKPMLRDKITQNKIISFSMDSIVNDEGQRMVVTYDQTAWGGVCTAIDEMEKRRKDFYSKGRPPYQVTIFGMGNLGIHAGKSCFKYLSEKLSAHEEGDKIPGAIVTYIEKDSVTSKNELRKLFASTDLLIDATKREDFSQYIITNDLIGCLKDEAIILDLTADPYYENTDPIQVKAFEGLPYGTLDKYVFEVDDEDYEKIPKSVSTHFRRVTVSCNGWPGVFSERSMKVYEKQLEPFIDVLMRKGFNISEESEDLYERALYRSTLEYFNKRNNP